VDESAYSDTAARIDDRVSLGDYLRVVWRRRWTVFTVVAILLAVTFVWTLRTPRIYESTAALIAPKEGSGLLGGLAVASGMLPQQMPGPSVPSLTPNRDMLVSILKSRTIAQAVVDHFKLREGYRVQYLGDAIQKLQGATTIAVTREGVITIKVVDSDPSTAAEIANFYMADLDRLVAQYGMGEAGRQRGFLTQQLARSKVSLDAAEDTLRRFQEKNRAIVLPEQTRGAIDAAARLKGEITAAEVQLQVMRSFATDANPEVVALRRRIDEMNRQLGRLEYGDAATRQPLAPDRRDFSVPFARVPEVGLELVRLTRDAKVQETIVTLLTQEVERARINEARDLPTVQVLDRAVPAERHSWPSLRLNLAVGGMTSLILGVVLALGLEYTKTQRPKKTV
jgi:uncharacterized protein involved in exopolysaccharide biosynthesis